jgi:hypothetical protein
MACNSNLGVEGESRMGTITQTEAPFKIAQLAALVAFTLLAIFATRDRLRTAKRIAVALARTVFPTGGQSEYSTLADSQTERWSSEDAAVRTSCPPSAWQEECQ